MYERYFLKLMLINGLKYHIDLLILDRSIDQRIEDINAPLDCIIKAFDQIKNSKALKMDTNLYRSSLDEKVLSLVL